MPKRIIKLIKKKTLRQASKHAYKQHAEMTLAGFHTKREMLEVCPPVGGFLASLKHQDSHCCIGQFLGHDYILLHRELDGRIFTITTVKLNTQNTLPDCFILHNATPPDIFGRIIKLNPHHLDPSFTPIDGFSPAFLRRAFVLARPAEINACRRLLNGKVSDLLRLPDPYYIHEITNNTLYTYSFDAKAIDPNNIDPQVAYTCSLATELEKRKI